MSIDAKISELISNLTWDTVSGDLIWNLVTPPNAISDGTDDIISTYIECTFKNQRIGLYERRYRNYHPDFDAILWSSMLHLVLLDAFGRSIYETTESSAALVNLYGVAKDSATGIDGVLDHLLET